jgi:protein yorkie
MYFMNHITKTTQWEDPRHQIRQQQLKEEQLSQLTNKQSGSQTPQEKQQLLSKALPQGWEQGVTADGEIYFINHISKTTTWFDPRISIASQESILRITVSARNFSGHFLSTSFEPGIF